MSGTWQRLRRAVCALVNALREANYWQRRMTVLRFAPDRYLVDPSKPADTYAEFMARTTGPLMHEPSARARQAGRRVG